MLRNWIVIWLFVALAGPAGLARPSFGQQLAGQERVENVVRGEVKRGGTAQRGAGGVSAGGEMPAAWARRSVLDELERLRGEIAMLRVLRRAQDALLSWNALRVKSGERPTALDGALCQRVPAWCEVLPASFGGARGEGVQ